MVINIALPTFRHWPIGTQFFIGVPWFWLGKNWNPTKQSYVWQVLSKQIAKFELFWWRKYIKRWKVSWWYILTCSPQLKFSIIVRGDFINLQMRQFLLFECAHNTCCFCLVNPVANIVWLVYICICVILCHYKNNPVANTVWLEKLRIR